MKCTPAETFSCINSEICKTGLFINKTIKSSFISFTIEKIAYMKIKLSICKTLFSVSFYSIYSMERLIKHKVLRIFTCGDFWFSTQTFHISITFEHFVPFTQFGRDLDFHWSIFLCFPTSNFDLEALELFFNESLLSIETNSL